MAIKIYGYKTPSAEPHLEYRAFTYENGKTYIVRSFDTEVINAGLPYTLAFNLKTT